MILHLEHIPSKDFYGHSLSLHASLNSMTSFSGGGQNRQSTDATPAAPGPTARTQSTQTPSPRRPPLSKYSTPAVQNCAWSSLDFMLGAGMVVIQPSTRKIVVVYDTQKKYWFLPHGRKDIGESLEQTALREAYEEASRLFISIFKSDMHCFD